MSDQGPFDELEERLFEAARSHPYPPTPDITGSVRRRLAEERAQSKAHRHGRQLRLAWTAALVLLLAGLLVVPDVRAALLRIFRIGSVEIEVVTPTPHTPHTPTLTADAGSLPATVTPPAPASLLGLVGKTTLAEAQQRMPFTLRLPSYPADLGLPDRIYTQHLGGAAVILVWFDDEQPSTVRLALHQLSDGTFARKSVEIRQLQQTTVHGKPAVWVRGEHILEVGTGGRFEGRRLVSGNTLIWTEEDVTYRLETDLPLEEAVRIAESLRPVETQR
ncbi:MAG: hypothetical protein KatS3mg057_0661 [Herpetosiphonaceae bacterium]|nr:MAG: hypothetical protein KatS3mg057_0661 [Herpetosiphonaceae bacterium]